MGSYCGSQYNNKKGEDLMGEPHDHQKEMAGVDLVIDKPIPQSLIDKRWVGEEGSSIMYCKVHRINFCILEEPCWECYNQVQMEVGNGK